MGNVVWTWHEKKAIYILFFFSPHHSLKSEHTLNCKCVSINIQWSKTRGGWFLVRFCCRRYRQQAEVADLVASAPVALLHRPELWQASMGEILHALLHPVHCLDCRLLLLHGLDGECNVCLSLVVLVSFTNLPFFCFNMIVNCIFGFGVVNCKRLLPSLCTSMQRCKQTSSKDWRKAFWEFSRNTF